MFAKLKAMATDSNARFGVYELFRIFAMLALVVACFAPDWAALRTMTFIAGVFFAITLISHITRKYALFPYLDLKEYAAKALEEPLAAAVVFASVSGIIIAAIVTASTFFARTSM